MTFHGETPLPEGMKRNCLTVRAQEPSTLKNASPGRLWLPGPSGFSWLDLAIPLEDPGLSQPGLGRGRRWLLQVVVVGL